MSSNTNQGSFCKTLCWVLGIAAGGYTAYALSTDFQVSQLQSGVLGIVTALLVGLVLRRILCRGNSNRLRKRLEETPVQSEKEASAVMAKATAKVAASKAAEKPLAKAEKAEKVTPKSKPKPTRVKVNAKNKIKSDLKVEKSPAATPLVTPFIAPEVDKIDETLVGKIEAATPMDPPEDEAKQGEDAPLKLSSILEVAPDVPVKNIAVNSGSEPEKIVISGDYTEDEVSEATKSVIAEITPVIDAPEADDDVEMILEPEIAVEETPDPLATPAPVELPKIKPLAPAGLNEPENGAPDELEKIDGIREDQIIALHKAGIYHFAQFVTMNRRELAWLDDNIPGGGDDAAGSWRKQAIQLSRKAS